MNANKSGVKPFQNCNLCGHIILFVGCYLAIKVFIGKLPATRGVWVIVG